MMVDRTASPIVTIAIPTYNRAHQFLRSAIECALAQRWSPLEVIVADNCSTDDTAAVVRSYPDSRLRYIRHENNIGANNNFNYCIRIAKGDYFLLLPDDDLIDPDMIEVCMDAANRRIDFAVIRTGTRLLDGSGKLLREIPNTAAGLNYVDFFRGWMRGEFTSYVCSTLFNTKLLREIGGLQSRNALYQDLIAIAKLVARAERCDVQGVKAGFRRHDANFGSGAAMRAWCEDGRQLAKTIAEQAPSEGAALYGESMRYLCRTIYGYARSTIKTPAARYKAYRMISAMFDNCYSPSEFFIERVVIRPYRILRNHARSAAKSLLRV